MKMLRIVVCVVVATGVVALPAVAGKKERVGDRLVLYPFATTTFQADTPFHIAHGWNPVPDDSDADAVGKVAFSLELDGDALKPSFVERLNTVAENGFLPRWWVYNFPDGLPAGTYTFTATWTGPCEELVRGGYYPGPCAKPTARVVAIAPLPVTVTFTS